MPVTSATVGGVNCWQFSGAVTDAQIQTAWAALVANGVYTINRAIYLDNTADLTAVTGGFLVNFGTQVSPAFVLHTGRDKTKSTFKNFTFVQSTGLTVGARSNFVNIWNGTSLSAPIGSDGVSQNGGGMVYGVAGNPGGGDPRFLNEMSFAGLEGATIYSQEFTEQELQIVISRTSLLKGITFEKCFGFPQIGSSTTTGDVNIVVYRSNQNTQHPTQYPLRLYPSGGRYSAVCYVDSYVTRNNLDVTTRLADFFGANATSRAVVMILNNYTRESWFGATKTNFSVMGNWNAANQVWGGVLKKLQFVGGDGATIRAYDSRSTTAAQKCAFLESGSADFLDASLAPTTDSTGKISLVHIGALSTGGTSNSPITRYTNQRYTFQKFGFRVSVTNVDMTAGGDNDLSAFTPIVPVVQEGMARTQAAITAATTITSFQDLLEELHVLAIGLSGSASYAGAFSGNLANFTGDRLTTSFTTVNVDATAASKIAYNSATNTLTIKASELEGNAVVAEWVNSGAVNLLNGAKITGIYGASGVRSTNYELRDVKPGAAYMIANNSTKATILYGVNNTGTAQTYTVQFPPGSAGTAIYVARKAIGDFFDFEVVTLEEGLVWTTFTDIPDEGAKETDPAVLNAYTALETNTKLYNYVTGIYMRTEEGIKLGEFFLREGKQLKWSSPYSAKVNQSAGSLFSKSGNLFTIKATGLDGDENYDTNVVVGGGTLTANTNEVLTTEIVDANGDSSLTIQGGSGSYEVWKVANGTPEDQYATGTLLADNVGLGKFRFTGTTGFYILVRDKAKNNRDTCSMERGTYVIGLYAGKDQITVAQLPEVYEIQNTLALMQIDIDAIPASVWLQIIETGATAKQSLMLSNSVLGGKVSGGRSGTETFTSLDGTKDRVVSVNDSTGNRTEVTLDLT